MNRRILFLLARTPAKLKGKNKMSGMTEADVLKFWEVREWIKALVATPKDESDLTNAKAILVDLKNVLNDSIGTFDRNVDAFSQNVSAGKFGKNYTMEVSRIHQPRGRKAGDKPQVDAREALLGSIKFS